MNTNILAQIVASATTNGVYRVFEDTDEGRIVIGVQVNLEAQDQDQDQVQSIQFWISDDANTLALLGIQESDIQHLLQDQLVQTPIAK